MKNSYFSQHGDRLLFALAIAVLLTAAIYSHVRRVMQPEVIEVVFTQWWDEALADGSLASLIDEFESLNEGIRIILNTKPYAEVRASLFAPVDCEKPRYFSGDVIALDPLWVSELLEINAIDSAEAPFFSFINVLFYNIGILEQAGLVRPPQNRVEFISFAAAAEGTVALGLSLKPENPGGIFNTVYPWIWAAGAHLVGENRMPQVNSPLVIQTLSFLAQLNEAGLIEENAFTADTSDMVNDFIEGKTAFMIAPSSYLSLVRQRMGIDTFSITAVPPPANHLVTPRFASPGWTVGIHIDSPNKEAANLFTAFLAGRAPFLAHRAGGTVPTSPIADPLYSKVWEIALAGQQATDFAAIAQAHLLEEIFQEELAALFSGERTPATAAAAIQQRWMAVLQ